MIAAVAWTPGRTVLLFRIPRLSGRLRLGEPEATLAALARSLRIPPAAQNRDRNGDQGITRADGPTQALRHRERDRPHSTGLDEPNGDQAQPHDDAALAGARASRHARARSASVLPPETCASSTSPGPPPSTMSRPGTTLMPVASLVPQTPSNAVNPGIGGAVGPAPLAQGRRDRRCSARRRPRSLRSRLGDRDRAAVRSRVLPPLRGSGVEVVRDHEIHVYPLQRIAGTTRHEPDLRAALERGAAAKLCQQSVLPIPGSPVSAGASCLGRALLRVLRGLRGLALPRHPSPWQGFPLDLRRCPRALMSAHRWSASGDAHPACSGKAGFLVPVAGRGSGRSNR